MREPFYFVGWILIIIAFTLIATFLIIYEPPGFTPLSHKQIPQSLEYPDRITNDSFQQGIEDGMNETYAPELHRFYLSSYRDGYKTGLTIKYCNCTGGTP